MPGTATGLGLVLRDRVEVVGEKRGEGDKREGVGGLSLPSGGGKINNVVRIVSVDILVSDDGGIGINIRGMVGGMVLRAGWGGKSPNIDKGVSRCAIG